ncbi:hypothetical protein [Glycomyces rhizosphaerae]|uniref:YbaB/EbfC DNA-binding family protein n=1 Tax=Glycomyces rhizosphaerae TaxID=2054422 RepID=A0ABV7Q7N8_9ACTN
MLTVVQGDSPTDAKVGLIEALLASAVRDEGDCAALHDVSVTISAKWPPEPPSDAALRSPFEALARQADDPLATVRVAADGDSWACLTLRDNTIAATTATVSGEALTSIEALWQQILLLGRSLGDADQPIRRVDATMHFQTMRLKDSQRTEAERLVQGWEPDRTL